MSDIGSAKTEIRDFLVSRRARITPEMAGLPAYGTNRRVKGLRREEVAMLAGISAEYYTRLERGNVTGASASVISGVTDALQLDDVEREHFARLVDAVSADKSPKIRAARERSARQQARPPTAVRPGLQLLVDSIDLPTFVFNRTLDIVACNRMGRLLYAPMFDDPIRPANAARFAFLDARAREFWPDWAQLVNDAVAELRVEAGRDPYDPQLVQLVGCLSTASEQFRMRWASHNVRKHQSGVKTMNHPVVGRITMPFEKFVVAGDETLFVQTYTPTPGSPAHDALQLLSSWDTDAAPGYQTAQPNTDAE
jgi:transcriptional regulator with XRE-family HTH domain